LANLFLFKVDFTSTDWTGMYLQIGLVVAM